MPLKEKDLRKVEFPAPSEEAVALINSYFAKRYLDKQFDDVLDRLTSVLEAEGISFDILEPLYNMWEEEQPPK